MSSTQEVGAAADEADQGAEVVAAPVALAVEPEEDLDGSFQAACPGGGPPSSADAAGTLAAWESEAFRAIWLAVAPSTRRAYNRAVLCPAERSKEF
ncbi:uncharacterized protein LOC129336105 isoform X2 [Eublepharis macularius]|uniref:Uncharacterized protein LOC129325063 isoform X2 n=1 Tax=Eublepharis macularius TaxID=481883 RepID=A0AA97J4L5_EUBMA|nr:uncharacterized protein LOC129325063 isoform X2 [Eublepharis macularius]XP_054830871.1 uncharacterized protein LOC129326631 isoform X2 [Eublepharis macularius]XP_054830908.1 uncharacterized protein LOC129326647 isoform X2 [Eublepharis macularius]XP_054840987.1 uncharacterized protein LOC129333390 isoform X2 [Eublepharis macularius]XP_054845084.1 uncharacterized protein LOC129336105 isoform X2 [Eublepharis macularius]